MAETRPPTATHVEYPLEDAADRLGITTAALKKRVQRGKTITGYQRDGQWYVLLPADADEPRQDASAATGSDTGRDAARTREDASILLDRITFLERQLEAERQARQESERELRRIIAGLAQRIPELPAGVQAPPEAPGSTETKENVEQGAGYVYREPEAERRPWWKFWIRMRRRSMIERTLLEQFESYIKQEQRNGWDLQELTEDPPRARLTQSRITKPRLGRGRYVTEGTRYYELIAWMDEDGVYRRTATIITPGRR
jgi:hypothetical protein